MKSVKKKSKPLTHQLRKRAARVAALPGIRHAHKHLQKSHGLIKGWWARRGIIGKSITCLVLALLMVVTSMYGVAQWYIHKHAKEPLHIGATFIPDYARYYGLDPQTTYQAMINDLGIRHFRLVSYWDDIEKENNHYDFHELDWQFDMAEAAGAKISLSIGLRQPRWPECHMPTWAMWMPRDQWETQLKQFMKAVINRYKDRPGLETYQLENEYFMKVFGICPDHSRDRLVDEYNFVKELDPNHPIIVSRSNNAVGIPIGDPRPDEFGISVYKRVWDKTLTHRYIEYPFPAWFYGFLAGLTEIVTGRDMRIHELQTEPWPPTSILESSLGEQDKSLNADRLRNRIRYGVATGMRNVDLWGVEWWYWRKVVKNDPSIWNAGKETIQQLEAEQGPSDGQPN